MKPEIEQRVSKILGRPVKGEFKDQHDPALKAALDERKKVLKEAKHGGHS